VTSPHDRPTAEELVGAVREFLERDVMDATTGRVQFHTRVAVNALKMVERELAEGAAMAHEHEARLRRAGFDSDAALARAISEGALDERLAEVREIVYESVVEKLRIANPDYLGDDEGRG
jgi:hypothetical protein